jgi:S-adenosylmethionine:tRNA ribosyltransferase-isomerase
VRPAKKLPVGATFAHPSGDFQGKILEQQSGGGALVSFTTRTGEPIIVIANHLGDVPLPPYIERRGTPDERVADLERYQTVYADRARQVAVAAPTAGLHFTPELLAALSAQGVNTANLTLHVGLGTFRPIATDTVEAHAIHREIYELPVATQRALFRYAGRRIAVGTTSVRAIEDFLENQAGSPALPVLRSFSEGGSLPAVSLSNPPNGRNPASSSPSRPARPSRRNAYSSPPAATKVRPVSRSPKNSGTPSFRRCHRSSHSI